MKVCAELLTYLAQNVTGDPPETGGILGSTDGICIDRIVLDRPRDEFEHGCFYAPDVDFLNEQLIAWQENGIAFMGMFHTHFAGVKTLSEADKRYIATIMQSLPKTIKELVFPIYVFPNRLLVGYRAMIEDQQVTITQEETKVI